MEKFYLYSLVWLRRIRLLLLPIGLSFTTATKLEASRLSAPLQWEEELSIIRAAAQAPCLRMFVWTVRDNTRLYDKTTFPWYRLEYVSLGENLYTNNVVHIISNDLGSGSK
ncbi:hypothetical protein AN958_07741 [Leucoagaricus sp. SymC.cos]|nr:hypothetical protein AN958_07741 [Leucoagaricus sp. SymC.cos]